jgi:hypothetical protein
MSRPQRGAACRTTAVLEYQYPTGQGEETATELIIDPAKFREVFTADLPQLQSDVYGLSQRPIAAGALGEETTKVAWKDLPTWPPLAPSTSPPAPTSSAQWPSAPTPRSPKSKDPTS